MAKKKKLPKTHVWTGLAELGTDKQLRILNNRLQIELDCGDTYDIEFSANQLSIRSSDGPLSIHPLVSNEIRISRRR